MPPERDLASQLGCGRETLRKVLEDLEKDGEIWRHVGQGTFRGQRPTHLPLRDTLLINGVMPRDVMRARALLEPQVTGEAARKATADDVSRLREKVTAGRRAEDRLQCEIADDAFHKAVAQVAGNPLLTQVLMFLSNARRRVNWQRAWDRTYRRIGIDEFRGLHSDQHARIVDAISKADANAAITAMQVHLDTIQSLMKREAN
ncbi:FadR/GntR family transcriptional regulator [Roseibium sp.]|uniref:FadR/GntR family transcriptional regulator n=1 Tax=Roseibium sp. TaxID=1936156 RepID=UPI003BAB0943